MMCEILIKNYRGATVTIALTGLPILITGEVLSVNEGVLNLKVKDSKMVFIQTKYIAFFY